MDEQRSREMERVAVIPESTSGLYAILLNLYTQRGDMEESWLRGLLFISLTKCRRMKSRPIVVVVQCINQPAVGVDISVKHDSDTDGNVVEFHRMPALNFCVCALDVKPSKLMVLEKNL